MRYWIAGVSLLILAAPGVGLAACPPHQKCPAAPAGRPAPTARRPGPAVGAPGGRPPGPGGAPGRGAPTSRFGPGGGRAGPGFRAGGSPRVSGAAGFRAANGRPFRSQRGFYTYGGRRYGRFSAGVYAWPYGYGYRPYYVGAYLPSVFWNSDYYITDYALYDLAPPPPDFEWIRYGPDLLLINVQTGQIAQSIPGAFDESAPPPDDSGYGPPPDGQYGQPPGGYPPPPDQYGQPPQNYGPPPGAYGQPPQGYPPPPQG